MEYTGARRDHLNSHSHELPPGLRRIAALAVLRSSRLIVNRPGYAPRGV